MILHKKYCKENFPYSNLKKVQFQIQSLNWKIILSHPDDWLALASRIKSTANFAFHYFVDIAIYLHFLPSQWKKKKKKKHHGFFLFKITFWIYISLQNPFPPTYSFFTVFILLKSKSVESSFFFLVNKSIWLGPWLMGFTLKLSGNFLQHDSKEFLGNIYYLIYCNLFNLDSILLIRWQKLTVIYSGKLFWLLPFCPK